MSVPRPFSGLVVALAVFALFAGLMLATPARVAEAATPKTGTVALEDDPETPEDETIVRWDGREYPVPYAIPDQVPGTLCQDAETDPSDSTCDHFLITVNIPEEFWETRYGGVRVRAEWVEMTNDFDMIIFCVEGCYGDQQPGDQVASSGNTGGTTNYEDTLILFASGTYEIRLIPFTIETPEDPAGDPVEGEPEDDTATTVDADGTVTVEVADSYPPNPERGNPGGLEFAPATVVDAQRTEGEPINFILPNGDYWESGPWGTATQQSFIHRSTDDGDSFHVVSPIQLRPNLPPGGGDTDVVVDDQGNVYFTDLEGLVQIDVSISNDGGNTWRKNPFVELTSGEPSTVDDRQWFALDNGLTDAADDNTIFLQWRQTPQGSFITSTPGSTATPGSDSVTAATEDPIGGVVYSDTSPLDPIGADAPGAPCGQLRFKDPELDGTDDNRFLYLPCGQGDHVILTMGHVAPSQRTDIEYISIPGPSSPGGVVGDIFPMVSIDDVGTVYLVWADEASHDIYYAHATNLPAVYAVLTDDSTANDGSVKPNWSDVRQVNGGPETASNVFPWAHAAGDGGLLVTWYGTDAATSQGIPLDSDVLDSWYVDPEAASQWEWYGYISVIQHANAENPEDVVYNQAPFTHKPMHFGEICNEGTFCAVSGGDRTMADYLALFPDPRDGRVRFVYNDTTSQHHGAHLFEVKQIAGPTVGTPADPAGVILDEPMPENPQTDIAEDAQWPHYGTQGPNHPQFDFLNLELSQPDDAHLRVEMTLADLATLEPPEGEATALWFTRFQALSEGDFEDRAYRIFYVGMETSGSGEPTFFAGSGEASQGAAPQSADCFNTTEANCKVVTYPAEVEATGTINGNVITIDVPLQGGFGEDRPLLAGTLYSVTAFSGGRGGTPSTPDLYADVDATRAFDYVLATGPDNPPPAPPEEPAPASPTPPPSRNPLPNTSSHAGVPALIGVGSLGILAASAGVLLLRHRRLGR